MFLVIIAGSGREINGIITNQKNFFETKRWGGKWMVTG